MEPPPANEAHGWVPVWIVAITPAGTGRRVVVGDVAGADAGAAEEPPTHPDRNEVTASTAASPAPRRIRVRLGNATGNRPRRHGRRPAVHRRYSRRVYGAVR